MKHEYFTVRKRKALAKGKIKHCVVNIVNWCLEEVFIALKCSVLQSQTIGCVHNVILWDFQYSRK